MAKALYKFHWETRRGGSLDGMFIAEQTEVQALIGKELYFGEVLGKHSEIYGELHPTDLTLLSTDEKLIEELLGICQSDTLCGYNPLDYFDPEEYDEEDWNDIEDEVPSNTDPGETI